MMSRSRPNGLAVALFYNGRRGTRRQDGGSCCIGPRAKARRSEVQGTRVTRQRQRLDGPRGSGEEILFAAGCTSANNDAGSTPTRHALVCRVVVG